MHFHGIFNVVFTSNKFDHLPGMKYCCTFEFKMESWHSNVWKENAYRLRCLFWQFLWWHEKALRRKAICSFYWNQEVSILIMLTVLFCVNCAGHVLDSFQWKIIEAWLWLMFTLIDTNWARTDLIQWISYIIKT